MAYWMGWLPVSDNNGLLWSEQVKSEDLAARTKEKDSDGEEKKRTIERGLYDELTLCIQSGRYFRLAGTIERIDDMMRERARKREDESKSKSESDTPPKQGSVKGKSTQHLPSIPQGTETSGLPPPPPQGEQESEDRTSISTSAVSDSGTTPAWTLAYTRLAEYRGAYSVWG